MSKARYMSITPHIYIRMLDGETKEQCEDRLVERIDPDGSAIIGWDEYIVPGTRQEVIAWMPMPKPYKPPKEG